MWGKVVRNHKKRLQEGVKALFDSIQEVERQEDLAYSDRDVPELGEAATLTSEKLAEAVDHLEASLQKGPATKERKRLVRNVRRTILPRLQKYEAQEVLLGDRNSFSNTDPDATFMRMKEDHMRNGQLRRRRELRLPGA